MGSNQMTPMWGLEVRKTAVLRVVACGILFATVLWACAEPGSLLSGPFQRAADRQTEPNPPPGYQDEVVLFGSLPKEQDSAREPFPPTPLIQHTWMTAGADFDPDLDPTGERLVFASTRHSAQPDIYVKAVDGASVTQLTADPAADTNPVFSPDGRRIAFSSNRSGNWDVWILDLADRSVSQITRSATNDLYPTWSPDGQRLAYCSLNPKSGDWELWVVSLEKEGPARFVGLGLYPRWSPVSDAIVFQRARRRGEPLFSIWVVKLKDGEPGYATEVAASDTAGAILPCWSPAGTHIAYCSVEVEGGLAGDDGRPRSENSDVWVVDRQGRGRVQLSDGLGASYSPAWSADGRVYFSSTRAGQENIWSARPPMMHADPTQVTRVGTLESTGGAGG